MEISGNVAQMRTAFHTQIHKYEVNGETHYANASDPKVPSALAPVVAGFVSLNNFRPRSYAHALGKANYDPKTGKAAPEWTIGNSGNLAYQDNFVLSPADYAVQYDLTPLYSAGFKGTGQTIAIINEANINVGLVNQFRSLFNLPVNPPQVIIDGDDPGVDGINNYDGPNYASVEAYLDVEWAGAVAPNATIDLVIAADTALSNGLTLAAERAVYSNIAPVISVSFGSCESALGTENQFLSNLWQQAAAQGITVVVSAGDAGSAGCDNDNTAYYATSGQAVNGFASTPYNIAVGGTDFYYSQYNGTNAALDAQLATYWNLNPSNTAPVVSLLQPIPEQPWNISQYGFNIYDYYLSNNSAATSIAAGGGGASNCATGVYDANGNTTSCTAGYPKPAWQTALTPSDGVRDLPDVSLFASNGYNDSFYPICATDGDCQPVSSGGTVQIYGVGGTSASAPAFAGIMALVNQKTGQRQGQANTVLYPMAAQFPNSFHDVTVGTISVPCELSPTLSPNCIAATSPIVLNGITEGKIGSGTTAEYDAKTGYDLATGLGTIDAANLVNNWGSVHLATSTTTFSPSSTSFAHGTAVTISGAVTGSTPTGSVALLTDSSEVGQQGLTQFPLSGAAYSGSVKTLPGGTYNIWGQYSGDSKNGLSTSAKTSITVAPETSGIDFNIFSSGGTYYTASSSPGSQVDYGTQLMLSALVAPTAQVAALQTCVINGCSSFPVFTTPTGTVAFKDGATVLNTAAINAEGDAEFNAPFAVGAHSVTAAYSGDASYNTSTASPIAFTVVKDTPEFFWGASNTTSNNEIVSGQPTAFNVVVENYPQYYANSVSSSGAVSPVPVLPPTGTATISSSPAGISGTVTLSAGVDPYSQAKAGVGTFTIPATLAANTYNVTFNYAGDANYNSETVTGQIAVVAGGGTPSTTTATMSGTIAPNSAITITGTVTGTGTQAPTGSILIFSSGNYINQASLSSPASGAVSSFSITLNSQTLFQGANFVTLQYTGDSTYAISAFTLNSGNSIPNPLSDFSLVPQTTIVPISISGGANSGTDTINLASMNGFSGTVTLTCQADPGVTCSIANAGLSSGGTAAATLNVSAPAGTANQTYKVLVNGKDSTGLYVHTLGIQALVTGSPAGSQSFALSNSGNINMDAGINTGNTSTITVTSLGGFTGTVALSCAVTPPTGATSPATCGMASPTVASASGTDVLTVTTTATTTAGVYSITVTGISGAITQTTTVTVNIGTPTFAMTNNGPISITRVTSTTGTATITLTPSNGFTGPVALSCVVASPTGANDPATCSIPTSATINGTAAQTATLTISTTAATALNHPTQLFWPSTGGAVLALAFFFGIPRRRRNWLAMFGLLVLFVSVSAIGCGGGGSSGGGGGTSSNPGTTAGTYTVTVTGTAGTITKTTAVTVTVQ